VFTTHVLELSPIPYANVNFPGFLTTWSLVYVPIQFPRHIDCGFSSALTPWHALDSDSNWKKHTLRENNWGTCTCSCSRVFRNGRQLLRASEAFT